MNEFEINKAIFNAATSGNFALLRELIQEGVGMNDEKTKEWVLKYTVINKDIKSFKEILKFQIDPKYIQESFDEATRVENLEAAKYNCLEILKILIEAGANIGSCCLEQASPDARKYLKSVTNKK